MNTPGYESLADVLNRAYDQAAKGKGAERHAVSRPFTEQPMQTISGLIGSHDGLLYQAMKKTQESKRMDKDAAVRELLGAINYLAGAIIFMEADKSIEAKVKMKMKTAMREALDLAKIAATMGVPTQYTCSCGHDPLPVPVGTECPKCDSPKMADRLVNAATGLATHWSCCNNWVKVGNACPTCFSAR